jgi:hypothetical protein
MNSQDLGNQTGRGAYRNDSPQPVAWHTLGHCVMEKLFAAIDPEQACTLGGCALVQREELANRVIRSNKSTRQKRLRF